MPIIVNRSSFDEAPPAEGESFTTPFFLAELDSFGERLQ
jgi:hypothetical protein